jgi:hypothetical protein
VHYRPHQHCVSSRSRGGGLGAPGSCPFFRALTWVLQHSISKAHSFSSTATSAKSAEPWAGIPVCPRAEFWKSRFPRSAGNPRGFGEGHEFHSCRTAAESKAAFSRWGTACNRKALYFTSTRAAKSLRIFAPLREGSCVLEDTFPIATPSRLDAVTLHCHYLQTRHHSRSSMYLLFHPLQKWSVSHTFFGEHSPYSSQVRSQKSGDRVTDPIQRFSQSPARG